MKSRYPLPLLKEWLNFLGTAQIYMKPDAHGAYNFPPMPEGDKHKAPFQIRYGLVEPTVMQFQTTNSPANFHDNIDNTK